MLLARLGFPEERMGREEKSSKKFNLKTAHVLKE